MGVEILANETVKSIPPMKKDWGKWNLFIASLKKGKIRKLTFADSMEALKASVSIARAAKRKSADVEVSRRDTELYVTLK